MFANRTLTTVLKPSDQALFMYLAMPALNRALKLLIFFYLLLRHLSKGSKADVALVILFFHKLLNGLPPLGIIFKNIIDQSFLVGALIFKLFLLLFQSTLLFCEGEDFVI